MIGDEFDDLMPHRITVTSKGQMDDYGQPALDPALEREYRCLLDVAEITTRTVDGTSVTVSLTAYVRAVPIGLEAPWEIKEDDKVVVIVPEDWDQPDRPLISVARHYDETGECHNMTLRFS